MKKLILVLLIGMISSTLYGQSNFYPIGAKWVYDDGSTLDNFVSEKDTVVGIYSFRKIKYNSGSYVPNQGYFLFNVTTNGAYLYQNDSLKLVYPFGLNVNDSVEVFRPLDLSLINRDKNGIPKLVKVSAKCYSTTKQSVGSYQINSYAISFVGYNFNQKNTKSYDTYNDILGADYSTVRPDLQSIFLPIYLNFIALPTSDGFYKLEFSIKDLLFKNSVWSIVNEVKGQETNIISFYPNPAQNHIYIEGNLFESYKIKSLDGSVIDSGNLQSNGSLNVENLQNGLYFIQLQSKNNILSTQKIIIQK